MLEPLSLSLNDFGAGVGQYGHALMSFNPRLQWRGFDGAGNVEQATRGFVKWFDLSLPLSLPRADWVMSTEVGEHVPHELDGVVVRNLHAHNCRGIIVSWANLNQKGFHHVNNHREEYITHIFTSLGYTLNQTLTAKMRRVRRHHFWFWKTMFVFDRNQPLRGEQGCTPV